MQNIVVFTGAGISAESGLGNFRDSGGLWEQYKIEDVATTEAFNRNPKLVLDFYNISRKSNNSRSETGCNIIEVVPLDLHKHFLTSLLFHLALPILLL